MVANFSLVLQGAPHPHDVVLLQAALAPLKAGMVLDLCGVGLSTDNHSFLKVETGREVMLESPRTAHNWPPRTNDPKIAKESQDPTPPKMPSPQLQAFLEALCGP